MTVEFVWPTTVRPSGCKFSITTQSITAASPLRNSRRVFGTVVDKWAVEMTLDRLLPEQWMQLAGLVATLDGPAGTIRMWEPSRYLPFGIAAGLNMRSVETIGVGEPFSDGSLFSDGTGWLDLSAYAAVRDPQERGAMFITLRGMVPDQPESLVAGDLMEIQSFLYQVARTVASDAAGETMCEIRPRLRTSILAGDPVKFSYPSSPFQLTGDSQAGVDLVPPEFGAMALNLVEVLPND